MLANALTREVGLKVGPVMFEVFIKHYFDRLKKDVEKDESAGARLKEDDVLYDEAFTIVKAFLSASTNHTVEELQGFSNTRTPSPPWTHVVRTLVPLSCCEDAATFLVTALGGEEVAKRLVGGVKWWQVRGINGVDAQWITSKKDWEDAKKRHKMQREQELKETSPENPLESPKDQSAEGEKEEGCYSKDMDAMRCILYLHGGGYYFGSVDQERYSIQRHARKINGRVFAINYRLAPQYPFPCALQDAVAAYLFLIRPPPGADHVAVNPAHIIIAGDSAGGGLSLALLQVIRDSGLPLPAGGFLISPWCDLTHSFPSIHLNTMTDVIPESGLSFHKPSILWPPPPPEVSSRVHASLRFRIRQAFKLDEHHGFNQESTIIPEPVAFHNPAMDDADLKTPIPVEMRGDPERMVFRAENGEVIEVNEQLHFYTQNSLLAHPLVSPANSYLGGLPPLLIIAGDKEVLRDEIIYTAHKAAYPERYPVSDRARELYPSLKGIEEWFKPTSVHLQVYDGTPHILPVLFSFTTPAKFCFRGIASFCKFVTEMQPPTSKTGRRAQSTTDIPRAPISRRQSLFAGFKSAPPRIAKAGSTQPSLEEPIIMVTASPEPMTSEFPPFPFVEEPVQERPSLRRALSSRLSRASSRLRSRSPAARELSPPPADNPNQPEEDPKEAEKAANKGPNHQTSISSSDVGGPRFQTSPPPPLVEPAQRTAGEVEVYADIKNRSSWECRMVRERVSTSGVIRPLEPETELEAFQVPSESIAQLSELTLRRYIRDHKIFEKKFSHTRKTIDKQRRRNLDRAKEDTIRRLSVLRQTITRSRDVDGDGGAENTSGSSGNGSKGLGRNSTKSNGKKKEIRENVLASPGWAWAWALDDSEAPPPSSIVSRRDTEEARQLAAVADQAIEGEDHTFSGNNLWSAVINFLTATPGRDNHVLRKPKQPEGQRNGKGSEEGSRSVHDGSSSEDGSKVKSRMSRFWRGDLWGSHSE